MKTRRQAVILDVIQRERVRNQEQLRRSVRAAGFDVTQATLSRDIRELALVKVGPDGAYQAPPRGEANGQTALAVLQRAMAGQLLRIGRELAHGKIFAREALDRGEHVAVLVKQRLRPRRGQSQDRPCRVPSKASVQH